jgi:hypothetical protein
MEMEIIIRSCEVIWFALHDESGSKVSGERYPSIVLAAMAALRSGATKITTEDLPHKLQLLAPLRVLIGVALCADEKDFPDEMREQARQVRSHLVGSVWRSLVYSTNRLSAVIDTVVLHELHSHKSRDHPKQVFLRWLMWTESLPEDAA